MKSCSLSPNQLLYTIFQEYPLSLNEPFLQENLDFLSTNNETFQGNILILLLTNMKPKTQSTQFPENSKLDIYYLDEISTGSTILAKERYDYFFFVSIEQENPDQFILALQLLFMSMKHGKGGYFRILDSEKRNRIRHEAILQGWCVDLQDEKKQMIFTRPKIVQNAVPLPKKKNIKKNQYIIKFDDLAELIDEDDLLEPSDLVFTKPQPNTCDPSTRRRKACKNCSCGLRQQEMEIAEKMSQMTIRLLDEHELKDVDFKQPNMPVSSCGNCYLGDAFRCSRCPYFGMPAFKPGQKIELQLNDLE
ncbi:hypothetical protein PORY_001252 [Pneumocystis oryctolagi]|uniref:Uncharacterized protein n=1 Tax=Pneumocystis oryctolagi TaxID=42067 RepID=A0ACB7CF10_9ASCO|nr:hypothetical protein PORY_001252 [Pneumocystis oryctolagi]